MKTDRYFENSRTCRVAGKVAILVMILGGQRNHLLIAQDITEADKAALSQFDKRVVDYTRTVHNSPSGKPIKPASDASALEKERDDARRAAQQARANAKQGDIFTPDVAAAFKKLLKQS